MSEALRNPSVMKKLQDEMESVARMYHMVCEYNMPKLVYLQVVVTEMLKIYPYGHFLVCHLVGTSYNVLGYEIPHGIPLLISASEIVMSPKSWKDAKKIIRDRCKWKSKFCVPSLGSR